MSSSPFIIGGMTHAEPPAIGLQAPSDHETIPWLKDMQWARYPRVGHGAHKHRKFLCFTYTSPKGWNAHKVN